MSVLVPISRPIPSPGQFSCCLVWGTDWGQGRIGGREIEGRAARPRRSCAWSFGVLERTAPPLSIRSKPCVSLGAFSDLPSVRISPIAGSEVTFGHRATRCNCCRSDHPRRLPPRLSTVRRSSCGSSRLLRGRSSFRRSRGGDSCARSPHAARRPPALAWRFARTSASATWGQTVCSQTQRPA